MTLVNIIIPTYNRVVELDCALRSVEAQTYTDWEAWICDDGSTVDTAAVVARFGDPRLRYLRLPHSGLPAVPRNAGIKQSAGELIAFLDSDDEWDAGKLERQVKHFQEDAGLALSWMNVRLCGEDPKTQRLHLKEDFRLPPSPLSLLLRGNRVATSTVMMRRSTLNKTGVFSEMPDLRGVEDYDLWLRVASVGKIRYDRFVGGNYHMTSDGLSRIGRREDLLRCITVLRSYRNWTKNSRYKLLASIYIMKLIIMSRLS